ncbi:hypothetical protein CSA37_02990 [Candidatus Fermentibacteria bacterium]|nr:MAG: hypothetical protein CSA37_02990 [Candidatus Fermentibacteria bacterium]
MKKLLFALAALPVIFAGCGGGEPAHETDNHSDEPEVIEVVIENGLESYDIEEILVDPSDGPWTDNRIEDILKPGDRVTIELEEEDTYDIKIIDEDGDTYTVWLVDIGEDGYEWEVTLADMDAEGEQVEVTVTNDLDSWSIWYLYASPSTSDEWGEDRLGSEILEPGESVTFTISSGTWYDFLAEDEDGDAYLLTEEYIDGDFEWNVSFEDMDSSYPTSYGDDTDGVPVTIHNDLGDWTIWYIYCDSVDDPWGEDRLGSELLHPDEDFTFYVAEGEYDIRVEDEDGDTYTLWGVTIDQEGYYWSVTLGDMD